MEAAAFLLIWLAMSVVAMLATAWWARRVWRRGGQMADRTKIITLVVVAAAMFGAVGTMVGLVKVFGAVGGESVDPSQRARVLAEGTAEAMSWTIFGVIVWLPSVIALAFAMRTRGARRD
jgi:biopolymer transport protein ExbB/TolQ